MNDFQHAIATVIAELTPQPWDYTDGTGATLTVIPAGMRADAGCAEVYVRVTASHTEAAWVGITTADMPALLDALEAGTAWTHDTILHDSLTLAFNEDGAITLTVTEFDWTTASRDDSTATVHLPAGQRLPLASALARATDHARGWEDAPEGDA
ncbi:hypothetical protein ACFWDI_18970 [Streptomyces sp. NPDC060064]|uniref:hypothetical protein n=1 Tax=Streptomyces sp. NPDC060064 TaxID=3347049 RepID=UPI003674ABF8